MSHGSGGKYGTSQVSRLKDLTTRLVENSSHVSTYTYIHTHLSIRGYADTFQVVSTEAPIFPRPDFFAGSRLNFAENLLYPANLEIDESSPAIIKATESDHFSITWTELRERVRQCANTLRSQGVVELDRVAGFLGNHANAVVPMLAAASIELYGRE